MNLSFGLVKTAADEQADALLAREARWLRELEEVEELQGQVPRVLEGPTFRHALLAETTIVPSR